MTTINLFKPLDVSTPDFLARGFDGIVDIATSSRLRFIDSDHTLDILGSGLRFIDGELLPFGEIRRIDLFDALDETVELLDMVWSLLKILSYYNPLTDRWDLDGLHDYLFREADRVTGSAGNDRMAGRAGDDTLLGQSGIDVAAYSGQREDYALGGNASGWQVADRRGLEGTDTLVGVERLHFRDIGLALDLDGHAGSVARLVGTLFGPAALSRTDLVGAGLSLLDQGMSPLGLSAVALQSDAFVQQAGTGAALSNAEFVQLLHQNVTGQAPDGAALAHYTGLLDGAATTRPALALWASETAELAARIDLTGLADSGLAFSPLA